MKQKFMQSHGLQVKNSYTLLFTVILCMFTFSSLKAADYTGEKWRVIEISLTSSASYSDPFNDVDVTATFTGPGGITIVRPAFWDGGTSWKIRFAPTVTGSWTMTTTATITSNNGLHNISKTIQCNAYTGSLDIYKKGFLKADASGRYFVYNDGTPFFYLGDTHWIFTHERFSTSNVSGVASQFKYTVDKRVTQGFSVYQSEAIQIPHGGTHTGTDEELHCDFTDGFSAADLPGFTNMDRKFKYVADNGLVHANSSICWAAEPLDFSYSDAFMYKISKYWVARYGAYPVLWTIAQEIDNDFYGVYNSTTMSKWYNVGQAIADNDAYQQPLSAHMEETGGTIASNSSWGSKPYHKWWAVQWQGDQSNVGVAKDFWNSSPAKPSILYEPPYENLWTDAKGSRGAGYKAFQSGMYGYGYGANGVWNDLYTTTDNGTAYLQPQSYTNWYDGANLPAAAQLTFLKNFYTSLEWWKLTPRFDDASWATFSETSKSMLATDAQNTFVVYFFGTGTTTGTLKNMLNTTYNARWFNPETGIYNIIGNINITGGQWTIPARPNSNDWILHVKSGSDNAIQTNLALNKTYSSSTNFDANQTADRAFDGAANTNWQSQNGTFANQWLQVNFGTATAFNKVVLSEYGNRTLGCRIEYSTDGNTWQTAYTGTTIGTSKTITFNTVTANYARVYFTSGTDNQPIVYEFEVYNTSINPPPSTNLALNKTYSSSSNWDGSQTADKACDGNAGTNWQAQNGTFVNQWLRVNFGAATSFDSVRLSEYGDRTTGYRIEYSTDGSTWQTAYTGTTIGTSKAVSFTAVTGNYARIYFTGGTSFAPIIYEFEIYKKPPPANGSNLALNKTYNSSSNWDATQVAGKAFDGTVSTNWQAQNGTFANQWLQVNFGTATTFNKVVLSEYGDRTQGFRIEYSSDGTTWQTAHTGTTIGNSNTINFTAVTANYARLYFTSGTSFAPIIYEFEIYNATANRVAQIKQPITIIDEKPLSTLYPNPSHGFVSVFYKLPKKSKASVIIYTLEGKVIQEFKFVSVDAESGKIDLNIQSVNSGTYIIKINSKDHLVAHKLIIVK
ncbi:MAG: discoidin domain-containing protein [Ferruginibacter sp.]|nr:discoidin domain-containing protein [Ferruginibacter sp.]